MPTIQSTRGGRTALENLCSLCRRHHTYLHEFGFRLECAATGGFRFFRPDGSEIAVADVPPALGPHPVDALHEQHRARGIAINAATNAPRWDGRPPDYDHIVCSLMPPPEPIHHEPLDSARGEH